MGNMHEMVRKRGNNAPFFKRWTVLLSQAMFKPIPESLAEVKEHLTKRTLPTRMAPRSFQMSRRSGFSTRFRAHTGVACAGIGARLRKHCCATSYACTRVSLLSSTPRTSTSPSTSPTLMTRGTMSLSCGSRRSTSCRGRCRTPRA